ncbi:hypothetical protein LINGRAHAP2_LOCUS343, partial [Linum grandiflorum]
MDGHCPLLSWIGRPELKKNKASFFVRGEFGQWRFNNKTSADSPVAFWEDRWTVNPSYAIVPSS